MAELTLKIIFCHLLGDFVLQTNKMTEEIRKHKFRSSSLYIHIAIHLLLLLVFTQFELTYLFPVLLLTLSHFVIDSCTKILFAKSIKGIYNFMIDQGLHLFAIYLFVYYFYGTEFIPSFLFGTQTYLLLISIVLLTFFSSVTIKKVMSVFNYPVPKGGLKDAGKYIGILERLFIFLFITISFWEGIGFLLAAKSIFRFGDLKESKDVKLTEYILIGTLVSFGIAIVISMLYVYLKNVV
ncbi:DUF3307 domain-containing protein [Fluviicola sp. SGL-29]|nr:DUF3307 domain-containing protein [Fluviicola sp. SGL-29]